MRLTAIATTCALGIGLLGVPAAIAADAVPSTGPVGGPVPLMPSQPAPSRTPEQQALFDAVANAKASGRPVVVDALTTEASKSVANPDGTLTTIDNAQPVRVKRDGAWADIDATLRANSDGSLSPTVSPTAVTLSGGGPGPMATVATTDGKELSVGAPFTLPTPSLDGGTATYANVLPGVDLQLTALEVGGWRNVIIVHTPEAAADPALKTLRFPISAKGLTVTADDHGQIDVKDDTGASRFRSPASLQWDSSQTGQTASAPAGKNSGLAAPSAAEGQPVGTPSTAEGPGDGANVAAMGTKVSDGAIELTPDQQALGTGSGPWYLDPSLTAVTSGIQGSVEVQENHPSYEYYNKKTNLATGYCGYHNPDPNQDCGIEGRQRAYFQFAVNPAIYTTVSGADSPPVLFSSTLNGLVTSSASPGTPTELGLYSAPSGIHDHSKWTDQPCGYSNKSAVMEGCEFVGSQTITGTGGPLAIDVTDMMKRAASGKWATWTVGIAPRAGEMEKLYRHHLDSKPSVTTTYDIAPTIWHPRTYPTPSFAKTKTSQGGPAECTTRGAHPWDNPGWIGSNQNIYLYANSFSPSGQSVYTGFHMWDDNDPNFSFRDGRWGGSWNYPAEPVSPGQLSDGHQYGWYAASADGILQSPMSEWCYFRVDRTNPRVNISSNDFPPAGTPNPNPSKYMNDWGALWINADDPAPATGLQASGLACLRVSTDPTPVVGWNCGDSGTYAPGEPYYYQARKWGINTVYAWAMDIAGNYSQTAIYNFYVPWRPGTQPLFGDVDNDQKPDIVGADQNGDLRVIGGTADPVSSLAATSKAAPGANDYGVTWSDFQLSHRGSLSIGDSVDQIIAHYNGPVTTQNKPLADALYLIKNDGSGVFDRLVTGTITRPDACTTYGTNAPCQAYHGTWARTSQLLAFGTPAGEAVAPKPNGNHEPVFTTQTSILTIEDGNLYLFESNGLSEDVATATLIPTASGSWADLELINPGAANGPTTDPNTNKPSNQPTLWARNRSTGGIYAYPLGWNADQTVDFSALTKPNAGTLLGTGAELKAGTHPRIGAGDLNSDGYADLWVIDNTNALAIFPGTGTAGKVTGFGPWAFAGYADASVSIRSTLVGWLCADAEGGPRVGAELTAYACWQTANQRFKFASDGTVRSGAFCMSTKDNGLTNGTPVVLSLCTGQAGQKWSMRSDGRLFVPGTVNASSPGGKCLELPGWATEQATRLGIWDCPGFQANQRWTLNPERTP
ncbi:ricin-type beta-trefoil lectin domain protein [Kitasatospora sp. NPDC057500]|uniref:ricin-type beta-trefoil lectin domain protein n=1 Tax=Kitasatospora sp. NPDC057500 TaxID=3346151 RepID=UPI0036C4C2FC